LSVLNFLPLNAWLTDSGLMFSLIIFIF